MNYSSDDDQDNDTTMQRIRDRRHRSQEDDQRRLREVHMLEAAFNNDPREIARRREKISSAFVGAMRVLDQHFPDETIMLIVDRLMEFPVEDVLTSLKQCVVQCKKIYLCDVVERMPKKDRLCL